MIKAILQIKRKMNRNANEHIFQSDFPRLILLSLFLRNNREGGMKEVPRVIFGLSKQLIFE